MHTHVRRRLRVLLRSARPLLLTGFALGLSPQYTSGQTVGVSPAPATAIPPYLTSDAGDLPPPATAPFQWGFVAVRPHAYYRLTRGDGIQFQPGVSTTTTIQTVSAGLLAEIGRHWTADYTPTWTTYSAGGFDNTLDHAFSLNGTLGFTNGSIGVSQSYSLTDSPRVETGRQTRQESAGTSLSVNYGLGRKTRLEVILSHGASYVETAPNTSDWSTQGWYHYLFSSRLDVAAGLAWGYTKVDPGIDMSYTRPQVRVGWKPTEKVGLDAHVGREQRQFKRAGAASLSSPNYGASAYYKPLVSTTVSLAMDRSVSASFFVNQVNETESWSLGVSQRLLERFYVSASASRSNNHYIPTGLSTIEVVRDDTTESYNFRVGTSFLKRGTIGLVYQHSRNSTNAAGYGFTSKQFGLEVGYSY